MKTQHLPSIVARLIAGTGRIRDRVDATFDRAQLGPSRERDMRAFRPRR